MLGIILCRGKELGLASEFAFWRSPKQNDFCVVRNTTTNWDVILQELLCML